jgi:hypothetical protein
MLAMQVVSQLQLLDNTELETGKRPGGDGEN